LNKYFIVYKPFNVLCQFTSQDGRQTLKNYFDVPYDLYPVGRLDYDSEGLLILSNDKKLNHALLNPAFMHHREYWVQVDGSITESAIKQLQRGVDIMVNGKLYRTKKCTAELFTTEPEVYPRNPPIRFRKDIPTSWIKLTLTEGKNRQVRKMTAAVGFPTLRLIRNRIENCSVEGIKPGQMKSLKQEQVYKLLFNK
jgi:23S rRNA pseudouridine2457 synthase